MRRRLHYTPNQITNNLYTTGSQWMLENETEYVGPYHTYTTGEVFTQTEWNAQTSKQLFPIVLENPATKQYKTLKTIQTAFQSPIKVFPTITVSDRTAGFITRYFLKKYNQPELIEIDSAQYTEWQSNKIDRNLYIGTSLKWQITGPLTTETKNGATVLSVAAQNIQTIQTAQLTMPEISALLQNPTQYYTDIDFVAPKDINGLDS
jgi:hypothetical protein